MLVQFGDVTQSETSAECLAQQVPHTRTCTIRAVVQILKDENQGSMCRVSKTHKVKRRKQAACLCTA